MWHRNKDKANREKSSNRIGFARKAKVPNDEIIKAMQECEKISQNDDIVEVDNVSNYLKGLVSNGFGLNSGKSRDIISTRVKAYFDKMLGIRAKFGLKKVSESSSFS